MILVDDGLASDGWDGSYCGKCGATDIGECSIEEWLKEEEIRKKQSEL